MRRRMPGIAATLSGLLVAACATPGGDVEPVQGNLLIQNVRTVNFAGEAPEVLEGASVLVRDGVIVAVRDAPDGLSANAIVDAQGMTLIPGLTDMHVHVWDEAELGAYLSWGVIRIRNMSGLPFHLDLQQRIERGEVTGPHLLTTGPILNSTGPNAQLNHQLVETAEEARTAVAWQDETGFRRLKVYSNLTRPAYEAVLEEAEARGLILTGHTPEGVRGPGVPFEEPFEIGFEEILDDGFETIEHVESIVWHALYDQHDEAKARTLAREIAAADVAVTPTLVAHHNLWRVADTRGEALSRPGTEMLNPLAQRTECAYQEYWAEQDPAGAAENDAFYGRVVKIFQEEGVRLVAGTDAGIFTNIPGLSLVDELGLMVKAGLTPYEAIRTATHAPAEVFGTAGLNGCVETGCVADLVLYECDPLADIACLETPRAVILGGDWLSRDELAELREGARHADLARTRENVLGGLAEQGVDVDALLSELE